MIKQHIYSLLTAVLKREGIKEANFVVEHPGDAAHGDYSTNVAMALFSNKELRIKNKEWKNPLELAQEIASSVQRLEPSYLEKVEAVNPGFINFWLSKEYLIKQLSLMLGKTPLRSAMRNFAGQRVMVEFTDPNPFKEFHIGHLYTNAIGESISRILEAEGAVVKRANYQGDVGMHVAKALYGLLQMCHAEFISASEILKNEILKQVQDDNLDKRAEFLGKCYAVGAKAYEEDEKAKKEIEKLNKQIYEQDPKIMPLYKKGREWSLEYFETIYKRLGTKFDFYYFESEVGNYGLKLVNEFLKKGPPASLDTKYLRAGIFVKSDNAVIFPGKKYALHNRVFINSQGLPTYEAKELGLNWKKFQDYPADLSVIITGNEVNEYFKVLLSVMEKIMPTVAAKTRHLGHGIVRLPEGKMSSRKGDVITGEWLLSEAKRRIKANFNDMTSEVLEKVAVGAVKYALLKGGIGRDIVFSFEESISLEGNSGPYLQYTFARTQSVLAKTRIKNYELRIINDLEAEETALLRLIYRFSEVVEEAAVNFAPNILCNYLFDLAQKFNLFYQKHRILQSRTKDFRLALTKAVGQILQNGLNLLGIEAPQQM